MNKQELELEKELEDYKHEKKMLQLKYMRDTERMKHENDLERTRIKSAEIRRSQMRKSYNG